MIPSVAKRRINTQERREPPDTKSEGSRAGHAAVNRYGV